MWQLRERIQRLILEAQSLSERIETLPDEIHSQARQAGEGIIKLDRPAEEPARSRAARQAGRRRR